MDTEANFIGNSIKTKSTGIQVSIEQSTQTEPVVKISRKLQTLPVSVFPFEVEEGEIVGESPEKCIVEGSNKKPKILAGDAKKLDGGPEAEVQNKKDFTNGDGDNADNYLKKKKHKKAKKRKHDRSKCEKDEKDDVIVVDDVEKQDWKEEEETPPAKKWKRNILERHNEETRNQENDDDEGVNSESTKPGSDGDNVKDPKKVINDAKELLETFEVKMNKKSKASGEKNEGEQGQVLNKSREIGKGMRIKKKSLNVEIGKEENKLIQLGSVYTEREPSPFWSTPGATPTAQSCASTSASMAASSLERPVTPSPTHKKNISSKYGPAFFSPKTPSGLTPVTPQATFFTPDSEQDFRDMSPPSAPPNTHTASDTATSGRFAQASIQSPFKGHASNQPAMLPPLTVKQLYTPEKPNHPPVTVLVTPPKHGSALGRLNTLSPNPQLISPKPVKTGGINVAEDSPLRAGSTTPTSSKGSSLSKPEADPPCELHFRSPQGSTAFQPIESPQPRSTKAKHSAIKALTFDAQVQVMMSQF